MSENPEQFRGYIAPILSEILEMQVSAAQGARA